jgi:hypothetical protein
MARPFAVHLAGGDAVPFGVDEVHGLIAGGAVTVPHLIEQES